MFYSFFSIKPCIQLSYFTLLLWPVSRTKTLMRHLWDGIWWNPFCGGFFSALSGFGTSLYSGIKNCFLPVTMVDKRFIVNKRYFKSNSIHKLEFRWELLIWLRFKSRVRNWKRKRLMWVRVLNFNFIYWIFVHIIDRSFQIVTLWFVAQMRPTNWFPIFQFFDNDRIS